MTPTRADIDALVIAMQAGLETAWKVREALSKGVPEGLPPAIWGVLERLAQNAAAQRLDEELERERDVYADAGLVMDGVTGAWVRRH
jgi:hypothetical protein